MSNVGSLIVELSANIAKFESDLGKAAAIAEKRMKDIDKFVGIVKTSLGALGMGFAMGATFDKVKSQIESAISSAAGLQQLSERTGAAVEQLSGLASVAKLSNTGTEELAVGLQKLSKSAIDAENGGKKTSASFKAIGISVEDLKGKRPDEMFDMVAKRLAYYHDGAEKVVIMQNLLGKSGANLLPVMKDLAEQGDLQVKVTAEQAAAADALEKNQIRLIAANNAIYKKIAMELVPVFNAFTKAMLENMTATNGIKKSVDDLAKDGSIRSWAEASATAVGFVVDAFDGVWRTVQITSKSIAAAIASISALGEGGGIFSKKGRAAFSAVWDGFADDSNAILNKTLFSDRLKNQIAASYAAASKTEVPRTTINTSGFGNDNKHKDPGEEFIKQLDLKIKKEQQDEFAMLRQEAVQKNVSSQAEKYIRILEADYKQKIRTRQLAHEINRDLEEEAAQRAKLSSFAEVGNAATKSIQNQTSMLGLNAEEQRRLTALRQIDVAVQQAMVGASADTVVELLKMSDVMKANVSQALQDNIDKQDELNASWQFGAKTALRSYLDDVQNISAKVANIVSNSFKGMEDALVGFTQTGKLSFSSLANSIISDMVRIAIQQRITGPLGSLLGSLFAPSVGMGSNAGGYNGTLNNPSAYVPLAVGTNYVPYDGFPALLHKGEAVVPASYNPAAGSSGGSGGSTIIINNTIGNVASQADVVAGMQTVKQQIYSQLARQQRYGGAMA